MRRLLPLVVSSAVLGALHPLGARDAALQAQSATPCSQCVEWNEPQRPFRLHGDTYFVGTHGLSAILITSPAGHVLIDGALSESAPQIRANIESLGFHLRDVKLILNTHAHYDHAGGIAELQRASGAVVRASPWSATVLAKGNSGADDPQFGVLFAYPAVSNVKPFAFGDTLRVGPIALVPHSTPGHTPGGTTWTWRSCAADRCLDFVYADSQSPVSSDSFYYSKNTTYPTALADFARGAATLDALACDVLITPHPSASNLWQRVSPTDGTPTTTFVDPTGCRRLAETARRGVERRVAEEKAKLGN